VDNSRYLGSSLLSTTTHIKFCRRLASWTTNSSCHLIPEFYVFHVPILKKYEGPVPLPDLLHGRMLSTLEKILGARLNRDVWELLIKWTGRSAAVTTWEQLEDFKIQFPRIELTNQLSVCEEENIVDVCWAPIQQAGQGGRSTQPHLLVAG
jgi:hypothetical protein